MGRVAPTLVALAIALGGAWLAVGAHDWVGWWLLPAGTAPDVVVVIPRGADASQRVGHPIWTVPTRLDLRRGQGVVVRNDDEVTHPLLGAAIAPGQLLRRTFPTPGRYYFNGADVDGVDCELGDTSQLMAVVVGKDR